MQLITIESTLRETGRKAHRATVRAANNVPAVIYGNNIDPIAVAINDKAVEKLLHTEGGVHSVVQLNFESTPEHNSPALIKAVQRHPIKDSLVHVDFMRIRLDQRIQTQVVIVLTGRAKGVLEGGVIDNALEVPEHIEVDISHLGLGESIHVSDLQVAEGVTILTDANLAVASVHMPRVVKTAEEEDAEGAEAADAEVETVSEADKE